jgi:NADH-quinone oxidoreductase subunit H
MPDTFLTVAKAGAVLVLQVGIVPLLVWFERKASAYMQDRTGPNRADIFGIRLAGLVHPIADVVKLIFKEDLTPPQVRHFYYRLAPVLALAVALMPLAVVPFADAVPGGFSFQVLDLDVGILYILAVGSFGVFGIIFAGWGSNNKYSLLGGMRASAQMISYELAMGLAIVGVIMTYGTLELNGMVTYQGGLLWGFLPRWGVFVQPLAAVLFFASALAETNRNPFDLPEGESEIVGFHVEYSSMKFAAFFMGEYAHIIASAAVFTTLFLGGWQIPWLPTDVLRSGAGTVLAVLFASGTVLGILFAVLSLKWRKSLRRLYDDRRRFEGDLFFWVSLLSAAASAALLVSGFWKGLSPAGSAAAAAVLQILCFGAKVVFISFSFIWVRWTLPRFRYDQLMDLGWKNLVPLALANLVATAAVLAALHGTGNG